MIPILYGSQTGASRYVCELISCAFEYGYNKETHYNTEKRFQSSEEPKKTFIIEMDDFNVERLLDIPCIIFVCSTHGDGTEPFNMSKFWRFLKREELPKNLLSHMKFAVFGMGDSSYDKYNYCSKRLYNRLEELGAKPILPRGEGDRQDLGGYLSGYSAWAAELFSGKYEFEDSGLKMADCMLERKLYEATCLGRHRLTPLDHSQNIIEAIFDIPEYKDFYPGDCIGIQPKNWNYKEFMEYNNLDPKMVVDIGEYRGMEAEDVIRTKLDFNVAPQHPFFTDLYILLKDSKEIEEERLNKIRELSEDHDLFYDYVTRPKRTIFEILQDQQIKVPMSFILRFFPKIYPRYYSMTLINSHYHITAAIVNFKTILREPRRSICSEYIKRLEEGEKLMVTVAKSSLFFGAEKILFICTGVGISLVRATVHYFTDKEFVIFYGFRHREKDFLYENEFKRKNVKLYTAASRQEGKYVQTVFRENTVVNIKNYVVIVSGDTKINREVRVLFESIYKEAIPFQSETW